MEARPHQLAPRTSTLLLRTDGVPAGRMWGEDLMVCGAPPAEGVRTVPPLILCAIADDDRLQDVVATGRALAASGAFHALFVHVTELAVAPPTALGFAAGSGSLSASPYPPAVSFDELVALSRDTGMRLLQGAGVEPEESVVLTGEPCAELNRLAEERDAALVVVGTCRHGAVASALLGSVSRALMRDGVRPVLIARSTLLPSLGGPVVCGVDLAGDCALRSVEPAAQLATAMKRPLVLVHVLTGELLAAATWPVAAKLTLEPTECERIKARRSLEALARRLPSDRVETVVVEGTSVSARLNAFAAARRADLLVVGCGGAGAWRRALEGSVSFDLLREGRRPLVVVPPE
jgi:nucleotide-binding universal stress UspA family protein